MHRLSASRGFGGAGSNSGRPAGGSPRECAACFNVPADGAQCRASPLDDADAMARRKGRLVCPRGAPAHCEFSVMGADEGHASCNGIVIGTSDHSTLLVQGGFPIGDSSAGPTGLFIGLEGATHDRSHFDNGQASFKRPTLQTAWSAGDARAIFYGAEPLPGNGFPAPDAISDGRPGFDVPAQSCPVDKPSSEPIMRKLHGAFEGVLRPAETNPAFGSSGPVHVRGSF